MQRLVLAPGGLALSSPALAIGLLADVHICERAAGRCLPVHWAAAHSGDPIASVAGAPATSSGPVGKQHVSVSPACVEPPR
jgi:hypothetical protein